VSRRATIAPGILTGLAALGALLMGIETLPPFLREIAWTLIKAMLIAVGACVVFVALIMRGPQRGLPRRGIGRSAGRT